MPRKKMLRLPNGFGSIIFLGDGRRRPYAAKTATKEYDDKGHPIRKLIGYFESWEEAFEALKEYNDSPYDINAKNITFKELYQLFVDDKLKSGVAKSSMKTYASAYNRVPWLKDKKVIDLKAIELQRVMDELSKDYKFASLETTKTLWTQMWSFAEKMDIVKKNYPHFVKLNREDDDEHSVPFTRAEIENMWKLVDKVKFMDETLVMCYSGYRISAYKTLVVNLDDNTFLGGVKTQSSKNRYVPIHHRILPLVKKLIDEKRLFGNSNTEIRNHFYKAQEASGLFSLKHTPHDCRATLATELDKAGANDKYIKRILGHSFDDVTQKVYVKTDIEKLRENIELVP